MKAIILVGGFGTKLREIVSDVPKPMAMIAGKPFLEHLLLLLKEQNITDIILAVHYMSDTIKSYFGNGMRWGIDITYSEEEIPLGTAGAIKKAEKYIDNTFLVLNGDSFSKISFNELIDFHKTKKSKFTMALTKVNSPSQYGTVVSYENDKIFEYENKTSDAMNPAYINSGIYVFEPIIFDYIEPNKNVSLEKDVFPKLMKEGILYGFNYEGYFMDISRPETFLKFKKDILKSVYISENESIKTVLQRISQNNIDLIIAIDENEKMKGVINGKIITNFLINGGNLNSKISEVMIKDLHRVANIHDDKNKIYEILFSGTRHLPILNDDGKVVDIEFRVDKIKKQNFPVIRGRSPLRVSFAGGGTDIPHFFKENGGIVISSTIDKYCYATMIKRADSKITINSDSSEEVILNLNEERIYDGKFNLIKAIINVMNLDFGLDIYIHNDVPPGRGLGSSASLAVLIVKMIANLQGIEYDDYKVAELAYKAETEELENDGGWQDQYAAVTGGFNYMEFSKDNKIIYPLRLKSEVIYELNHHLCLCYVGNSHYSGDLQKELIKSFNNKEKNVAESLNELKKIAIEIKNSLLTNNIENIGRLLHQSWENKKKSSNYISNPKINRMYELGINNGAYGGKLLGAGGGGYILFFIPPQKRNLFKTILENEGGEIINFNFEFNGAKIWNSQKIGCFY
jgi:D-glycero-alpha-D-manno-heptose-7-phosphate kinase